MHWYQWFALAALAVCMISFAYHFFRLIKLGRPKDYSARAGSTTGGIVYSFTTGMNPRNKESAFLHLPTYTAGVIFHIATFLAIVLFFLPLSGLEAGRSIRLILSPIAFAGAMAGFGILIKRHTDKKLRLLSSPDDYISNLLVTFFQLLTGLVLLNNELYPAYMIVSALLLLYMPVGKLKHAIYFFAARYHLGLFYGWRNVWPMKKL